MTKKGAFFGQASYQKDTGFWASSGKAVYLDTAFSFFFFLPQVAQLDNNSNKAPTSCDFHLPEILELLQLKYQQNYKMFLLCSFTPKWNFLILYCGLVREIPDLNTAGLHKMLKHGAWKFLGSLLIFHISCLALRVPEDL